MRRVRRRDRASCGRWLALVGACVRRARVRGPRSERTVSGEAVPESERWESFRATAIPATGVTVSTVLRPSSALGDFGRYYETMAFHPVRPGILWQSAAFHEGEANRQHSLSVRWFSRKRAA